MLLVENQQVASITQSVCFSKQSFIQHKAYIQCWLNFLQAIEQYFQSAWYMSTLFYHDHKRKGLWGYFHSPQPQPSGETVAFLNQVYLTVKHNPPCLFFYNLLPLLAGESTSNKLLKTSKVAVLKFSCLPGSQWYLNCGILVFPLSEFIYIYIPVERAMLEFALLHPNLSIQMRKS